MVSKQEGSERSPEDQAIRTILSIAKSVERIASAFERIATAIETPADESEDKPLGKYDLAGRLIG